MKGYTLTHPRMPATLSISIYSSFRPQPFPETRDASVVCTRFDALQCSSAKLRASYTLCARWSSRRPFDSQSALGPPFTCRSPQHGQSYSRDMLYRRIDTAPPHISLASIRTASSPFKSSPDKTMAIMDLQEPLRRQPWSVLSGSSSTISGSATSLPTETALEAACSWESTLCKSTSIIS